MDILDELHHHRTIFFPKAHRLDETHLFSLDDDDKIPTKAFLKCSQSSAAKESNWGIVTVGIICAYVVYGERERGRKIQNFQSSDMAFQVYQL